MLMRLDKHVFCKKKKKIVIVITIVVKGTSLFSYSIAILLYLIKFIYLVYSIYCKNY